MPREEEYIQLSSLSRDQHSFQQEWLQTKFMSLKLLREYIFKSLLTSHIGPVLLCTQVNWREPISSFSIWIGIMF